MVVIDGGANKGVYINRYLHEYPDAIIHAFEPQISCYEYLVGAFGDNDRVVLNNVALGEKSGENEVIYCNYGEQTSSLLEWDTPQAELYTDNVQMKMIDKYPVKVVTISEYCMVNWIKEIELIKLDLQGYEMRALKGAGDMLFFTRYILLELTYIPKYVGQSTPQEIEELLFKYGFEFVKYVNPRMNKDVVLLWQDGLYCNYVYNNRYV